MKKRELSIVSLLDGKTASENVAISISFRLSNWDATEEMKEDGKKRWKIEYADYDNEVGNWGA